jgi:hypothetical protein
MQQQHSIMGGGGSMGQTASILMQNGGQLHLQPATNRAAAIATTGIQVSPFQAALNTFCDV